MFTGIVSHLGEIHDINRLEDWQLAIKVNKSAVSSNNFNDVIIGASVACSGICLTVKKKCEDFLYFDVSDETASKTNFLNWKIGNIINLEKSLRVGDEIGGHFVYGHVDTTAKVKNIEKISGSYKVVFSINTDFIKYFAQKGSVTIDGVSLRKEKCEKDGSKTLSFLKKCKVLKMPVIDDSLISVENFAKMTLDHCNETKVKNLKTKDGKAIKVTDEKSCNIKFINFKKYEFAKVD